MFSRGSKWSPVALIAAVLLHAASTSDAVAQRGTVVGQRASSAPAMRPVGAVSTPFAPNINRGTLSRSGTPITIPSVALQSINPVFQLSPFLTLPQAAFNTAMIGQALQQVPGFGFTPAMLRQAALQNALAVNGLTVTPNGMLVTSNGMIINPSVTNTALTTSGFPITIPSIQAQSINPVFRLSPFLTLPQAAFNTAVLGQALQQVPFGAGGFGFFPRQLSAFGGGYGGFPMYPYSGFPSYPTGGYAMPGMSSLAYGGDDTSVSLSSPYNLTAAANSDLYSSSPSTSYSGGSNSSSVSDPTLIAPDPGSTLVSSSRPQGTESTRDVWLFDDSFSPPTTVVQVGTTVRWINYSDRGHSVTSLQGLWDSGTMQRGAKFSITFTKPGSFSYASRAQPNRMTGTIVVNK
jgi:plastocyanin